MNVGRRTPLLILIQEGVASLTFIHSFVHGKGIAHDDLFRIHYEPKNAPLLCLLQLLFFVMIDGYV